MWTSLFVVAASAAAPSEQIEHGFDLYSSDRPEEAVRLAASLLHDDPSDLAAHRLYIVALSQGMREGPAVEQSYRAWVASEPDNPVARIALAVALQNRHTRSGPWCDEIDSLIEPIPADAGLAYLAHRARYEIRRECPGDREADRAALLTLGEELPAAWGYRMRLLAADGEVTVALRDELVRFWDDQPSRLGYAASFWGERYHGEGLEDVRVEQLARARVLAQETERADLLADVIPILRQAEDEGLAAAEARLAALDPERGTSNYFSNRAVVWMRPDVLGQEAHAIYRTAQVERPRARLKALGELDEGLPDDGPLRAVWWDAVARAEDQRGDDAAAAVAWAGAWRADPTDPDRARKHGWAAREAGEGLEGALAIVDEGLALVAQWDARGDHYTDNMTAWIVQAADERARLLEVRGELLRELDRLSEARDTLAEAVLLAGGRAPFIHIRLARTCAALGDEEAALAHFGQGFASGDQEGLTDWWAAAAREARALYATHRWSPGGFDGWIASIAATLPEGDTDDGSSGSDERAAWMRGQPFPDLALLADGEPDAEVGKTALSDVAGIRVVDLWATWCGPCISSLPDLDAMAEEWTGRGVTFLAISVDEAPQDVIDWLDDNRRHQKDAYTRAWAGPGAMAEARVTGIPAVFILDPDGQIHAFRGGSSYEGWLEEELTALLGPE